MFTRTTVRLAIGLALLTPGTAQLSAAPRQSTIDRALCSGSPCANPLELTPGQAVVVSLRGNRLGQLASGTVQSRGGFRSQGISVELGQPLPRFRGRRRNVTLTADTGAPSVARLNLQFTVQTGGTVTAPLQLSVVLAQPGNVVITDITTDPNPATPGASPTAYSFMVTVQNQGGQARA